MPPTIRESDVHVKPESMEDLIRALVRAGQAVIQDPSRVVHVHADDCIEFFDDEYPRLASCLAMQDLLGRGDDEHVFMSVYCYRRGMDSCDGPWAVYPEQYVDPKKQAVFARYTMEGNVIMVFNKSNKIGSAVWVTRDNNEFHTPEGYWADTMAPVSVFVRSSANTLLNFHHVRMQFLPHEAAAIVERRFAIAQIEGIPSDILCLLANMQDPWDAIDRSLRARGYAVV